MSCCSNPDIQSSTYSDWCTNCGWAFSYLSNEECAYEETDTHSMGQIIAESEERDGDSHG